MKYLIVDTRINSGDEFVEEFDDKDQAIIEATDEWRKMCKNDKDKVKEFYVLESENPDVDSPNHYDGWPIKVFR